MSRPSDASEGHPWHVGVGYGEGWTIDCTNKGGNLVESHTTTFSDSNTTTVTSAKNGQLSVPAQSASAFGAPHVCPNPNWTPSIRAGTLTLETFTYTLTFAGFSSPYITITASDP
jgi:hypothetical protein